MSIQKVYSSSSSSAPKWKYDVFLSFRGEDTRNNFVGHVYHALTRYGIYTYKDDITLPRGKTISPELLKSIEESRFSVVVMSKNYARSHWCLEELANIIRCMETMGQTVVPIFYNVDPSHVRKLDPCHVRVLDPTTKEEGINTFAEAFVDHEQKCKDDEEKVQRWKQALIKLGSISGWDSRDRDEFTLIQQLAKDISSRLFSNHIGDGLVGMDAHVQEMLSLLSIELNDVRMVGIWGIGGIGKTTIAKVLFNRLSSHFDEGRCFLLSVKESLRKNGETAVKKELLFQLLSVDINVDGSFNVIKERLKHRKVLIVLDDVDDLQQLELLAGDHDWFGLGSRIIITTRDKHLLDAHDVKYVYEVDILRDDQALQLFQHRAFEQQPPPEEFLELSYHFVHYAKGLPLVLEVLGSFLKCRSKKAWESELKKLERAPNEKIQNVLRVSYDGLEKDQQRIFLDVACFFRGNNKIYVKEILDACGFCSEIEISVLLDRSLLKISGDMLEMHDLLQEMGREIVRQEEFGKRSRLWIPDDIFRVFTENTGSKKVEGIVLDVSRSKEIELLPTAFKNMRNLRLLKVFNPKNLEIIDYCQKHKSCVDYPPEAVECYSDDMFDWDTFDWDSDDTFPSQTCKVQLPEGLESLPSELSYLHWYGYPLKSLPSNFSAQKLVKLNLSFSNIEQLWEGKQNLGNVKEINLSFCTSLTGNINLSGASKLERLILNGCSNLQEAPSSISSLKKLNFISLTGCHRLRSFPSTIQLEFLEFLYLNGCSSLSRFPEISQNIICLDMRGTKIKELSSSIGIPHRLQDLKFYFGMPMSRPCSISKLSFLQRLSLSYCSELKSFPEITETMKELKFLHLIQTAIKELPSSIEHLSGLEELHLTGCENLERLPSSIWSMKSLQELDLSSCSKLDELPPITTTIGLKFLALDRTGIKKLPSSIKHAIELEQLHCSGCKNLEKLAKSIWSLKSLKFLNLSECSKLNKLPRINDSSCLESLNLSCCNLWEFPDGLEYLSSLTYLILSENNFESIPASIKELRHLAFLSVSNCKTLKSLPELPPSLGEIDAEDCISLETVSFSSRHCMPKSREFYCISKLCYNFVNCLELTQGARNSIVENFLEKIQIYSRYPARLCIPATEIPKTFSYHITRSLGTPHSFTLKLPSNWCDSKFMGFVICAVISDKPTDDVGSSEVDGNFPKPDGFNVPSFGIRNINGNCMVIEYNPEWGTKVKREEWLKKCSDEVSFSISSTTYFEECWVHLIYAQAEKKEKA